MLFFFQRGKKGLFFLKSHNSLVTIDTLFPGRQSLNRCIEKIVAKSHKIISHQFSHIVPVSITLILQYDLQVQFIEETHKWCHKTKWGKSTISKANIYIGFWTVAELLFINRNFCTDEKEVWSVNIYFVYSRVGSSTLILSTSPGFIPHPWTGNLNLVRQGVD